MGCVRAAHDLRPATHDLCPAPQNGAGDVAKSVEQLKKVEEEIDRIKTTLADVNCALEQNRAGNDVDAVSAPPLPTCGRHGAHGRMSALVFEAVSALSLAPRVPATQTKPRETTSALWQPPVVPPAPHIPPRPCCPGTGARRGEQAAVRQRPGGPEH